MWGQPNAGFTFADPSPLIGRPVPGPGPVAPVIPGAAPQIAPAGPPAVQTAAGAATPSGPQPIVPGQPVRNAISRGREALGGLRERTGQPGPARDFVSDFAAGVSQPTQGGPLAAFLQGFAGAVGNDRSREAARAAAAAEAEEREYQRSRDAREDARLDRGEDRADRTLTLAERRAANDAKIEQDRLAAERERNRLLNAKTAAEIATLERAANSLLTTDDLNDIEMRTNAFLDSQRALAIGNGFMPLEQDRIDEINAMAEQYKAELTEQYLIANGYGPEDYAAVAPRAGGAPAGAAAPGAPGATLAPLPPIPGMTGNGTQTQPYAGESVNPSTIRQVASQNRGRDIFFVDPATGQLMVVNVP